MIETVSNRNEKPASPWLPVGMGLLAVGLTLSSLRAGLCLDDYSMLLNVANESEIAGLMSASPLDLFRFLDGDVTACQQMMDRGALPWWTDPAIKIAFWRPIASVSHFVDFRFWSDRPWLMHLHSVLLYGLVAGLAAVLYRRWTGPVGAALLAAILFAADHAHGTTVGWLANRNAVLAALFGLLALWAHDRWRREGWRRGPLVATGCLLLSLLSGEVGITTCAYLFAHAVFLDPERNLKAVRCLWPYAVAVMGWRLVWTALGYGTGGTDLYTDPLVQPGAFLRVLLERAPVLMLGQWAAPPSDLAMMLGPDGQRMHRLVAVLVIVGLAAAFLPAFRRDRVAGFYATGMVLSLVPACAVIPSDRSLFFAGLGAMGLMGILLREALGRPRQRWPRWWARAPAVTLAGLLAAIHLLVSPIALVARAAFPSFGGPDFEQLYFLSPLEEGDEERDFVVVQAPLELGFSCTLREARGLGLPRSIRALSPGSDALLRRIDDRTVSVRPHRGFSNEAVGRVIFRSRRNPMQAGDRVDLPGLQIEVTEVDRDGSPLAALFRFEVPLEDASLKWFQWKDGQYTSFPLPPVGEDVLLETSLPNPWADR